MPRSRSFRAVTGPTPQSASTGSDRRNGSTRSGAITVSPSGFCQPEAIFARNLFGATPADAVSPVADLISVFQSPRDGHAERLAPRVLRDIQICLVERERFDERSDGAEEREDLLRHGAILLEIGRDDHERRTQANRLAIEIAERTPKALAS